VGKTEIKLFLALEIEEIFVPISKEKSNAVINWDKKTNFFKPCNVHSLEQADFPTVHTAEHEALKLKKPPEKSYLKSD
jgi:hypothetical protein